MNTANVSDILFFIIVLVMFIYFFSYILVNQKNFSEKKKHPFFEKNILKALALSLVPLTFYIFLAVLFFIKFIEFLSMYGGKGISSYVVTGIISFSFLFISWKYSYYKSMMFLLKRAL